MLIKLFAFFFLICITVQASSQTTISFPPNMHLLNKSFDTILFESANRFDIILLSSENTCSKCYDIVFDSLLNKHNFKTANIMRVGGGYLHKRKFFNKYKVFKLIDSSYFDIYSNTFSTNDSCNDGFLSVTQTCRTPALIIHSIDNKFILFKYDDIFDNSSFGLNRSFINNLSLIMTK